MNIQSVDSFNAAVSQLGAIKGDVTAEQLSSLTDLFSTQIWNTSDAEGTSATLDRQIAELQALLDEIQADIDELYEQQKSANDEMNALVNDLNQESYQASKQADKNIKEQQDLVSAATDAAYNAYMKGEIEKEEIPLYIANQLSKSNPAGATKMQTHLEAMDAKGQKITSISNKIASMLDSINEFKAKYETTEASLDLLQQLKAMVPEHKTRDDIQQTIAQPYYSPSQEALGDKLIDAFRVENKGTWADGDESTTLMNQGLQGSGTVDEARKAELDAMSPEDKAAAVEEADTSKYSVPELLYLSGMDQYQAAAALDKIFGGAGVGYNTETGALKVPLGHNDIQNIYNNLKSQYTTLWGGEIENASETETGATAGADPIGWRDGDTNFMFALDRDSDNIFDGAEEFVGANGEGWAELTAFDVDGDGILTADELAEGGVRVVDVNQALTNGGTYGFNGVKESGFESIDLSTYRTIDGVKSTNLNGNTRVGEFTLTVNGEEVLGKQTENQEAYNEAFYGHMYGEAYSFGLDPNEVANALAAAAKPEDYMAAERAQTEYTVQDAQDTIDSDKVNIEAKYEEAEDVRNSASENRGQGLVKEEDEDEETATNTNDNTASSTSTDNNDEYIIEE